MNPIVRLIRAIKKLFKKCGNQVDEVTDEIVETIIRVPKAAQPRVMLEA